MADQRWTKAAGKTRVEQSGQGHLQYSLGILGILYIMDSNR